ncbi:hypothetical protein CLU79DRAFT_838761 [Phycomyces nitens]|nr:hypothetical protein CLU79DRAFT_838761 [Phycomyces nitens]
MQQIKRTTNLKNKQDIDEQDPQLATRLNLQMLYTVLDNLKLKQTAFDVPPKKGMEQKDDDDDDEKEEDEKEEDEKEDETDEEEEEEEKEKEKEKEKEEKVVIKQEDDETVEIKQEDDIHIKQEECMAIKKEEEYVSIKQEDDYMAVNEVKMHMAPNQEREDTPMKQERTILGWESILSSAIESKVPKDVIERVYRQLSKLYKITLPSIERHLYTPLNTLPKPVIPLSVYERSVRDLWTDDEAQMKMVNDIERKFAFLQEQIRNDTKGGWDK